MEQIINILFYIMLVFFLILAFIAFFKKSDNEELKSRLEDKK